jgi:hypothetical protein
MSRSVVTVPRTAEGDAAWARLNHILDENGGKDTPEYRQAWREWEIAVGHTEWECPHCGAQANGIGHECPPEDHEIGRHDA